jgi:hypothetical protein
MGVFEFLLALYSIVAGLGIAVLVRSIAQMIEARDRVRLYGPHSCFLVVAFVAQVVSWLSLWRFAGHTPWTVADTLFLLSIPLILYVVSHLVVPELEDGLVHDLREYYYRHARWIHGLMLAGVVVSLIGESFILGRLELAAPQKLRMAFGLVLLPGVLTANPKVHAAQAVLLMILMALGVSWVSMAIG